MKRMLIAIIFVAFLTVTHASEPTIHTIASSFVRSVSGSGTGEVIKGTLYFQAPNTIIFKVTDPISQWMIYKGDSLLIYYPKEKIALRMKNQILTFAPIFQVMAGAIPDDLGLPKAGYTLMHKVIKNNLLITTWDPPAKLKKSVGQTIIGLANDHLVLIETHDVKEKMLARVEYRNYSQFRNIWFPLEMTVTRLQHGVTKIEKTSYMKPVFNQTLPETVANFHLPENVTVKDLDHAAK